MTDVPPSIMSNATQSPVPPKTTWKPGKGLKFLKLWSDQLQLELPWPIPRKVKVVRALYKYTAERVDELSFEEGSLLYVFDKDGEADWWRAKCGSQEGLIPANYVEEQTEEIELPLHDAARRGNLSFLKEYLRQGVSGTGLDAAGNTPLFWASRAGHVDCVKELLGLKNPAVDAQNKMGDTPLHAAAGRGHVEVVTLLLEAGAHPELKNADGSTAEDIATQVSVKNAIQLSQRHYNESSGYADDDYKDESD